MMTGYLRHIAMMGLCDAGASQASQRGDKGQLEKHPTQILKYLESLMKPSSGGTLVIF
jgi:hypothetical protein